MLNVDTHLVVDFFLGRLRPGERELMDSEGWGISAIVLWELYSLAQLGRIDIDVDEPQFNRDLARLHVWPISMHVCRQLRKLDFARTRRTSSSRRPAWRTTCRC